MTETFTIARHFTAPPALVWRAWTEAGLLAHWYGPGVETVIHALDVRAGGQWLTEMKMGPNSYFQRADFTEVAPEAALSCLMSTTDADWNTIANPMMPDWPRVLRTDVTLAATETGTDLTLVWTPHEATEAELACFAAAKANFGGGWGKGFDMLEEMLAKGL